MATYNHKLMAVQTAMTSSAEPGRNWHGQPSYFISFDRNYNQGYILLSFDEIPTSFRKKELISGSVHIYVNSPNEEGQIWANNLKSPFDENTVTFNSHGTIGTTDPPDYLYGSQTTWASISIGSPITISQMIKNGAAVWPHRVFTTGGTEYTLYSHLSSYVPYLEIFLQDYVIRIAESNASPSKGFINEKRENTFSWNIKQPRFAFDEIGQSSAKFRWRPDGESNYTEIQVSGNTQSVTIPAGTFTTDKIQWQVVVTSDDGIEGTPSDWFTLTTVDSKSSAKAVSPDNVVVDGSFPVEFRWNHIIDTGSEQTKYELEYSSDNGLKWTPLKSESTSNTFATIPADTLPAGSLLWKVRTYNTDNVAGDWSEPAGFVVRAAPTAPSISSISAEPRPVVRWQAVGQQAYEISVYSGDLLIYTTGETAGTEKERKIQEYLQPGVYTVRMRVWNSYNMASPWGSGSVTVPNSEITPPFAAVSVGSGYAEIVGNGSSFQKFYILRDGVPIAKMQDGIYRDYAVVGTHTYVVRGVTANDLFADSEPQTATISLPYSMAASVSALSEWVPMIYRRNADPAMTESIQSMGQAVFVSGRALPIFEQAEYWNNTLSFVYSYRTAEEYNKMRDLLRKGETVRYRGRDGAAYWMVLTGLQTNVDYLSRDFTLSAQEVDYVEEIPYDMEEG